MRLTVLLALVGVAVGAATDCPGSLVTDTVADFDLARFVSSSPWYTQEQVTVSFQSPDSFYCTRALYRPEDPSDLSKGINVINYSNMGGVNGMAVGTSGAAGNFSFLQFAVVAPTTGPSRLSKLLVGPKQLLQAAPAAAVAARLGAANGNYRVLAVGPEFEWAIILGGAAAPSEATGKGCGPSKAKDEGMWIFTSEPVGQKAAVAQAKAKAAELGIDTSRLQLVVQEGCKYIGADPARPGEPAGPGADAAPSSPADAAAGGRGQQAAGPAAGAAASKPCLRISLFGKLRLSHGC